MTTATLAKKTDPETEEKSAFVIPANLVTIDVDGFATRLLFIRLPEGMPAQALDSPAIWRLVQGNPDKSLKLFDKLLLVAFDESWIAEALVVRADAVSAVISKPRLTTIPVRYDKLFEDETYRVKWFGTGFAVERKADNQRVTGIVANAPIAERDLVRLHPVRA
ncbi:hypothetical protein [Reyranella sp.]|uniref:hypothetical protein n=1 Tax=Reyranella sp. TaxID=1929291 RepID=UPI003D10C290